MHRRFIAPLILIFIPALAFGQVSPAERAALEAQLAELERQIGAYQATIDGYRAEGKTLNGEIRKLDAEKKKLNLEIKAITLSLTRLDSDIVKNQANIKVMDAKLRFNRHALGESFQALAEGGNESLIEVLMKHDVLSDFFNDMDGLLVLKDDLRGAVERTVATREELLDLKEELALKKADTAQLKVARDSERAKVAAKTQEKNDLLARTKGKESEYQKMLVESQKTAAQIRSRIFEFLGGGQLTFEAAYRIAKDAAAMAGIRPALLLAVLDKESALGKNVGRCKYQTAMHPSRDIPIFLVLMAELGLAPDSVSVSCANSDGAYGGAMGPSQFIPSTWNLYRARVEALTSSRPPSPWRNMDAFMATALYLKDSGAGAERNAEADRRAAARYYAGGRWRNYLWTYGERVVSKARQFEEDIAALGAIASKTP